MENEFGGVYHQMNWSPHDLLFIHDLCKSNYNVEVSSDFNTVLLNIADRIEKELGVE